MTAASVASVAGAGVLRRAAWLVLCGYAIVLLVVALVESGVALSARAAPITFSGSAFEPLRGRIDRLGDAIAIEAADANGLAVVGLRTAALRAEDFERAEYRVRTRSAPATRLLLVWRTRESPGRTFSQALQWTAPGIATASLTAEGGWRGTVVSLAVVTQGPVTQPIVIDTVTLSAESAAATAGEVVRDWSTFFPWRGNSFTFPFDEERTQLVSLLTATVLAELVAALGYAALCRRRQQALDARVLWAIFLAGWLVLDARWQLNLWRQLGDTARQFAGKTIDLKHRAEDDHQIYELMQELRARLPAPPVRILFLSDNPTLRTRGSYFLLPHNVYHQLGPRSQAPPFEQVRPGDHVLLLFYSALRYDPADHVLVWPDGRTKPVTELFAAADGPVLLRVR